MGLFDFVKGAGEKLFGSSEPEEAAKADPAKPAFDPDFTAQQLQRKVEKLGLPVEGLSVGFAEGVATVSGRVPSREVAEKIVLQLGNTTIVEGVEDQLEVEAPAAVGQEAAVVQEAVVAAAEPAPVPEPTAPAAVFYTVQKGDTLSKIAKEQYGTWKRYPEIFEANTPMLKDPDLIYPGQVLRIPGAKLA
jgi:nucleoid-associated protein YgaU